MGIKPPIGIKAGWQPLRSMYMCSFWYCLNIGEISAVAKVHLITKIILIWIKAAYAEYNFFAFFITVYLYLSRYTGLRILDLGIKSGRLEKIVKPEWVMFLLIISIYGKLHGGRNQFNLKNHTRLV